MAADLAGEERFEVTVADIDGAALERLKRKHALGTEMLDLSDPRVVRGLAGGFDLVLSAVPGSIGFETLKAVIEAGRNVVDIAFFPEDPFELGQLAEERGVTAIVDCGVAPGMSNLLVGHVDRILDGTHSVLIYVGGLPEEREWPWEYKAVFSPADVIEEYIRPARYVENGRLVTRPALSEPELIDLPQVGTLEAFNSDGLRTLAKTIDAPDMKEKTLRYPGHIEKIAVLRETGFFNREKTEVGGAMVSPLELTSKLLFPKWELKDGDADFTVMRIIVDGMKDEEKVRYTYDLLDRCDERSGVHSMARTTGYTATVALRMVADGLYAEKGISPPEFIGRSRKCVEYMVEGLKRKGIEYVETVERPVNSA